MLLVPLPKSTVDLVAELVKGAVPEFPYTQLKTLRLGAHS
jgi:hypothetical protein